MVRPLPIGLPCCHDSHLRDQDAHDGRKVSNGDFDDADTDPGWSLHEKGQHWGGDLPRDEARKALKRVLATLRQDGWNIESGDTKILMLTHRVLAAEQGYSSLPDIFKYSRVIHQARAPAPRLLL
jgi:hypothetical protein